MKLSKQLHQLIESDTKVNNLPKVEIFFNPKDKNHLSRRLQQRAISWDMIRLAIAYGKHQYYNHARTWTLLDKNLQSTPYAKFIDKLRGLRIIAEINSRQGTLKLSTAYWAYDLRH